jgi:hypothetical protein
MLDEQVGHVVEQSLPSDRLITLAPCVVAQSMPAATPLSLPDAWLSRTLTGMIVASKARPATPMPLLVHSAMVPVTWVPWPWSSFAAPGPVAPVRMFFSSLKVRQARSSADSATPLSITATLTPRPVDFVQASGACTLGKFHCAG